MTDENVSGCPRCWPESAENAWAALAGLVPERRLVDDSHFTVSTLRCPACQQAFVRIFTEMIDWAGGQDPMDWTVLPVSPAEHASLLARGEGLRESELHALGRGRRSLRRHYPKGEDAEPRCRWGSGLFVGPHD
jgi:hypothetical protein